MNWKKKRKLYEKDKRLASYLKVTVKFYAKHWIIQKFLGNTALNS